MTYVSTPYFNPLLVNIRLDFIFYFFFLKKKPPHFLQINLIYKK